MHHTQTRASTKIIRAAFAMFALAAIVPLMAHATPDGALLTGTVKSAEGARMNGVTVSAKMDNATITTSVFTDEEGTYYFPAMNAGRYEVWAQADGFETARGDVNLAATKHQDFILKAAKNFEQQLS
jgi:Carboxypeptidase regulatory-like domain